MKCRRVSSVEFLALPSDSTGHHSWAIAYIGPQGDLSSLGLLDRRAFRSRSTKDRVSMSKQ
jgi:hypothetical protein